MKREPVSLATGSRTANQVCAALYPRLAIIERTPAGWYVGNNTAALISGAESLKASPTLSLAVLSAYIRVCIVIP